MIDNTEVNNGVITTVVSELITRTAKGLFNIASVTWKKSKLKTVLEVEKAFQNYVEYIYPQNQNIKTLLYKNVAKPLYNFYEPVNVKFENKIVPTSEIKTFFESIGPKIVLTGSGGIGKSTLLKHFFLNSIDTGFKIPLLIELRNLNLYLKQVENFNLTEYIYATASMHRLITDFEYFKYALEQGYLLVLFDGLDELDSSNNELIEKEIIEFSKFYYQTLLVVSFRPSDQFTGWHEFTEVKAQNLTKTQALSLINKLEFDNVVAKNNFYTLLDGKFFDKYESFASIPLLLTIMLLTYEMNASIPENLNDFYEMAFLALFQTHDASKSSFSRDIKSKLTYEEFKEILSHISFNSYYFNEYTFTESNLLEYINLALNQYNKESVSSNDFLLDLQQSVCMIFKDGLRYTFSHRSFQEYFAAVFVSKQSDEVQKSIFMEILKSKVDSFESIFFQSLKYMQPNRYNKNLLYELAKEYIHYTKEQLLSELILSIILDEEDYTLQIIRINNTKLWFVYSELFQNDWNDIKYFISKHPSKRSFVSEDNKTIDIINLQEKEKLLEFLNIVDGTVFGVSILYDWIKSFEQKNNIEHNSLTSLLGLKLSH